MEPQIDMGTGQQVYGRSKSGSKGCFGIIGAVVLLIIIFAAVGYFYIFPMFTNDIMRGELIPFGMDYLANL